MIRRRPPRWLCANRANDDADIRSSRAPSRTDNPRPMTLPIGKGRSRYAGVPGVSPCAIAAMNSTPSWRRARAIRSDPARFARSGRRRRPRRHRPSERGHPGLAGRGPGAGRSSRSPCDRRTPARPASPEPGSRGEQVAPLYCYRAATISSEITVNHRRRAQSGSAGVVDRDSRWRSPSRSS